VTSSWNSISDSVYTFCIVAEHFALSLTPNCFSGTCSRGQQLLLANAMLCVVLLPSSGSLLLSKAINCW